MEVKFIVYMKTRTIQWKENFTSKGQVYELRNLNYCNQKLRTKFSY